MAEREPHAESEQRPRVLIPIDAEEALRALARFAYSAERADAAGPLRSVPADGD